MTAGGTEQRCPRILVIRNRYLGDTVLAIPFLRNLRRHFPTAVIDVLVEHGSGAVLADCPYVNRLITLERAARRPGRPPGGLAHLLSTARMLRGRRYDQAYVLKRSWSAALIPWLAGIPRRVGFAGGGRGVLLTTSVSPAPGTHEGERYLETLRAEGLDTDDGHNENWVSPRTAAFLDALVPPRRGPRVFVAPCSTAWEKQWPLDRMAATVSRLIDRWSADVFLCGSRDDVETHDRLRAMLDADAAAHVHDFSTQVDLGATAGLLSRMDLFLGIDTGLMHLAASAGVPTVAIFGPFDAARWHPWGTRHVVVRSRRECVPCNLVRPCPIAAACMRDVTVDEVFAAAADLLGRPGP